MSTNQTWLDATDVAEDIIEADLKICDPHHHFWDQRPDTVEPRYLLDEFLRDIGCGHNVLSTVFMECGEMFRHNAAEAMQPIGETEFANGIAAMSASGRYGACQVAAGIVGTAYLQLGDAVAQVLDAQLVAAGGRLRGIRQGASWDASPQVPNHRTEPRPDLYMQPVFRRGFAHLASRQLSFDAWCYHPQLAQLADLARAFPDTTIILDHFGTPLGIGPYAGKAEQVFADWKRAIKAIAACPNVMAKLGGLAMPVNGFAWDEQARAPDSQAFMQVTRHYYDYTIECFGVDRCMFESNFPVDKISVSYKVLWNAFKRLTKDYTSSEKAQLFHDNAVRTYRL